jgi:hypothetical protein
LSTCYGIVTQAGGSCTVESQLGVGFQVLLPRTFEEVSQPAAVAEAAPEPFGSETILIVEDDQAFMRATATTLKKGGYTILTASNGDQAWRLVQRQSHGIERRGDAAARWARACQISGDRASRYAHHLNDRLLRPSDHQ